MGSHFQRTQATPRWGPLTVAARGFRSHAGGSPNIGGRASPYSLLAGWHDSPCAVVSLGSLRRPEHPTAKLVQESEDPRNIIAGKQCKCRQTEPQIRCRLADIADE